MSSTASGRLPAADDGVVSTQELVIVIGLALAGWGHLLVHDQLGAARVWAWVDGLFPPSWRSAPPFAGATLLVAGAACVLVSALGR